MTLLSTAERIALAADVSSATVAAIVRDASTVQVRSLERVFSVLGAELALTA